VGSLDIINDLDDFREKGLDETTFSSYRPEEMKVLVVGATGRVGKILTRKLLLRGYQVRALVRSNSSKFDLLPPKVEVLKGDVMDIKMCRKAVYGVKKVVYCLSAQDSCDSELLQRVYENGIKNIVIAWQDALVKRAKNDSAKGSSVKVGSNKRSIVRFEKKTNKQSWQLEVSSIGGKLIKAVEISENGSPALNATCNKALDSAKLTFPDKSLLFNGKLSSHSSSANCSVDLLNKILDDCDSIVLRIRGDGQVYICLLEDFSGEKFSCRFSTTARGHRSIRLPLSKFRNQYNKTPNFLRLSKLRLQYEKANIFPAIVSIEAAKSCFNLSVEWIKAIPLGEKTDIIMIFCARKKFSYFSFIGLRFRREENTLRKSGLGYTIVRPGPLLEEPGGYRALVFDQGDRIHQNISCADVADVCLRALGEPAARNITFEVGYECSAYDQGKQEIYELVAHLPDKSNNYLALGLSNLEKNN
jgi:hypothetical protein